MKWSPEDPCEYWDSSVSQPLSQYEGEGAARPSPPAERWSGRPADWRSRRWSVWRSPAGPVLQCLVRRWLPHGLQVLWPRQSLSTGKHFRQEDHWLTDKVRPVRIFLVLFTMGVWGARCEVWGGARVIIVYISWSSVNLLREVGGSEGQWGGTNIGTPTKPTINNYEPRCPVSPGRRDQAARWKCWSPPSLVH